MRIPSLPSLAAIPSFAALVAASLSLGACTAEAKDQGTGAGPDAVIEHTVKDIDGREVSLKDYRGKALLVVNVASECGFTPQYAELEKLHRRYQNKGLVVLGFPSNDFGGQEPGSPADIKKFASEEYGVTFPLFDKVHAKGEAIAPLYKTLTTETRFPGPVKWNFTKFLVDPAGRVVARFPSDVDPLAPELLAAVDAALPKG